MILQLGVVLWGGLMLASEAVAGDQVWNLDCNTSRNIPRAVGANFSVTIISPCRIDGLGCRIRYLFYESGSNTNATDARISVNGLGHSGSEVQQHKVVGATIYYSYRKEPQGNEVSFNLQMFSENRAVEMYIQAQTQMNCTPINFQFALVNFTGCEDDVDFIAIRHPTDVVRYMNVGDIVCNKNGKGRAIFSNESEALQTYCDADASWKDFENITCLYPTPANVTIGEGQYKEVVSIKYNHSAGSQETVLNCLLNSNGSKNATKTIDSPYFKLENENVKKTLLISPNLNGKRVFCYINDTFAKYFTVDMTYKIPTSRLNIEFGPYPPPMYTALCMLPNRSIPFYYNPPSSEHTVSLIMKGSQDRVIETKNEMCCERNYEVNGQMITPNETLDTSNSTLYLRYNESGNYSDYKVVSCGDVTQSTTVQNPKTTVAMTDNGSSIAIPIAIVAGIIVLLIALLLLLLYKQRQREKFKNSGVVLVHQFGERHDVVIDDQTAETYAVIDRKIEGRGQVNSGFDEIEQNDSTYSAVDQKPTQKGTNGSVLQDTPESAVTYYEVNENNKGAPNFDQTATLDTTAYAAVDKSKKKEGKNMNGSRPEENPDCAATYSEVIKKNGKVASKSDEGNLSNVTTYAAVDLTKKKEKKNLNKSGPPDLSESTATYSEVITKNKKGKDPKASKTLNNAESTDTYAEVNKKNKKHSGGKKSSQPHSAGDATYAEVERRKKDEKDSSGLQTDPDATATYAEVNKKNRKH